MALGIAASDSSAALSSSVELRDVPTMAELHKDMIADDACMAFSGCSSASAVQFNLGIFAELSPVDDASGDEFSHDIRLAGLAGTKLDIQAGRCTGRGCLPNTRSIDLPETRKLRST